MAEALTHVPVRLTWQWQSKTVTKEPPRYVPHDEWKLVFTIGAETLVRVAAFVERAEETLWGLLPSDPAAETEVAAFFFPFDWKHSDDVHVSFGYQTVAVSDSRLKADARGATRIVAPVVAETGRLIALAELPGHSVGLSLLVLAAADTERRRQDRWRVKPTLAEALPERVRAVASGHQHGRL